MSVVQQSLFDFGFSVISPSDASDAGDNGSDGIECSSSADRSDDASPPVRPNVSLDRARLAQLRVMRAVAVMHNCVRSPVSHAAVSPVADVAFSADGKLLCHGQMNGSLVVHKYVRSEPPVPVLSLTVGARIRRLQWDVRNDSNVWMLVAGQRTPLRLFDLARTMGEPCDAFEQEFANVSDVVQLSANAVAVACSDGFVRVLDRRHRRIAVSTLRARIVIGDAQPLALACSGDRNLLAVGDTSATLSLWDIRHTPLSLRAARLGLPASRRFDWLGFDDDRWPERLAFQLSDSSVGVWDTLRQRVAIPAASSTPEDAPWLVDRASCAFLRSRAGSGGSVLCCGDRYSNNLLFLDPAALLRAPRIVEARPRLRATNDAEFFVDEYGASHRVSNMTTIAMHSDARPLAHTDWSAAVIGSRDAREGVTSVAQHPSFDIVALGGHSGSVSIAYV